MISTILTQREKKSFKLEKFAISKADFEFQKNLED